MSTRTLSLLIAVPVAVYGCVLLRYFSAWLRRKLAGTMAHGLAIAVADYLHYSFLRDLRRELFPTRADAIGQGVLAAVLIAVLVLIEVTE